MFMFLAATWYYIIGVPFECLIDSLVEYFNFMNKKNDVFGEFKPMFSSKIVSSFIRGIFF